MKKKRKIFSSDQALLTSFLDLTNSILNLLQDYEKIHNVETLHEIERMISIEINEILSLFKKLNHSKAKNVSKQYIAIFTGMKERIQLYLQQEDFEIEQQLQIQTKILQKRYLKKADD